MNLPKFPTMHARTLAGAGIYLLTLIVLAMLYFRPELGSNDLFKMMAQGIVMQGLVGLAMAHYFTASHREMASGQQGDPLHVQKDAPALPPDAAETPAP